jgi:hypothetical protein
MDKSLLPAVIGAAAGALVAALGWLVVHALSSRRELIARRDLAARDHLEKQIEQLYGPLLGLIQHSRLAFEVAARILPKRPDGQIEFPRFSPRDSEVWHFLVEEYFLPVNAKIRDLMRSKMHLFDEGFLPKSFDAFFAHEVQFEALHRLWKEKGIDSPGVVSLGWPAGFEAEVQAILDSLRLQHQAFLRRLGASGERKGVGSGT